MPRAAPDRRSQSSPALGLGLVGLGAGLFATLHGQTPAYAGGICGHAPLMAHCPGCYVAAALIAGGAALASASLAPARLPVIARP